MSVAKSITIAQKGLSFGIIRRTKLFPTLKILNSFLLCGFDDAASGMTIQWEPFTINESEYNTFRHICEDHFGQLRIDCLRSEEYSDWFSKAALMHTNG